MPEAIAWFCAWKAWMRTRPPSGQTGRARDPQPPGRAGELTQSAKLLTKQALSANALVRSKAGDARNDVVTWSSSAPNVATVDATGTITAVGAIALRGRDG